MRSTSDTTCTRPPRASISCRVATLLRGSVTHRNRSPRLAASTAIATPKFPDDDSTRIEPEKTRPVRSAAASIPVAALSLIEPAKLKPSHLR